jgi:16S rRNA (uracil1498-N3)-methyltransferase
VTAPLFWAPPAELAQARPGHTFTLTGPEAHHAVAVKRLRVGESALLSDAAGRLAHTTVLDVVPGAAPALSVLIDAIEDVPLRTPRLILVQALTKQRRDEAAVAAATALGVDAIIPWQAARSVARWLDPPAALSAKAAQGAERWLSLARAEAKVARRPWVPEVLRPADSAALAGLLSQAIAAGSIGVVLHEDAGAGLAGALAGLRRPDSAAAAVYLITGPEGGISSAELAAFAKAGCVQARLGPEVLRAGLAGPAALAVSSHLLARWP